jgi:hypothetical protein
MNSSFLDSLIELDHKLHKASDIEVVAQTVTAVGQERESVTVVLHHLREVDRRRLYSALKYKSLHQFATKHLHYTDDEAYRRIAAMKLLRALPEIEERIISGDLTLTHLNKAQTFFHQEEKIQQKPLSKEQKIHVIEQMRGTSVREADQITLALSSIEVKIKPDKLKQVTKNQIEVRFTAREELQVKTEKLKGFLAHSHPGISLGELYEKLCDLGLEHWDPSGPPKRSAKRSTKKEAAKQKPEKKQEKSEVSGKQESLNQNQAESFAAPMKGCVEMVQEEFTAFREGCVEKDQQEKSEASAKQEILDSKESVACQKEYQKELVARDHESFAATREGCVEIPQDEFVAIRESCVKDMKSKAQIRREVFHRAASKCENCGSEYALEIDHIIPQALGGSSDSENLRLLCRHCNQRAAIETFGQQKMDVYLSS